MSVTIDGSGIINIPQLTAGSVKATEIIAGNIVGQVCYFAMQTAPIGFLSCDGSAVSRTTYSALFTAIGTLYGSGDGSTTFTLPDLRAEFIRGFDDGRGVDSGRVIGSLQTQQTQAHKHISGLGEAFTDARGAQFGSSATAKYRGIAGSGIDYDNFLEYTNDGTTYGDASPNASGVIGTETRPRNVAMLACIKY